MKIFSLVLSSLVLLSQISLAAPTCKFRPLHEGSGVCSDDEFTNALWLGDVSQVQAMVSANSTYLYSCNYSPSFMGKGGTPELMNPLTFAICHTVDAHKVDMAKLILNLKGKAELNCETPDLRMKAKDCIRRISDDQIRNEVTRLLEP